MTEATPLWSARQQDVLTSLGMPVWVLRSRATAEIEHPPAPAPGPASKVQPTVPVRVPTPAAQQPAAPAAAAPQLAGSRQASELPAYALLLVGLGDWVLVLDSNGPNAGRFARDVALVINREVSTGPMRLEWPGAVTGALSQDAQAAAQGVRGALDRLGATAGVLAVGPQAAHWTRLATSEESGGAALLAVGSSDLVEAKRDLWQQLRSEVLSGTA